MYQKTIVRYELNDKRYKVDDPTDDFWDKWQFPCFLGMDNNNNFVWYNCCFDTIVERGDVHKLFFFESEPNDILQRQHFVTETVRTVVDNLINLGLIVKSENGKTYKYVFEGYKFEKLTIKEILGIEAECFIGLSHEQFNSLEKKLENIWKKQAELYEKNKELFIDLSNI